MEQLFVLSVQLWTTRWWSLSYTTCKTWEWTQSIWKCSLYKCPCLLGTNFGNSQVHKEHKVATHLLWGNSLYQGQDLTNCHLTWIEKCTEITFPRQGNAWPHIHARRHRPVFTYKAIHTPARWHPSAAHWRGLHQAGGKWDRWQQKTGWDPGIRRKGTFPLYTLCFFIVSPFHSFQLKLPSHFPHSLSHFFPGPLWPHRGHPHHRWMGDPFVLLEVTKPGTMERLCEEGLLFKMKPIQQESPSWDQVDFQTG